MKRFKKYGPGRCILCGCIWMSVLLGACTARLDVTTRDSAPRIVVYGTLTTEFVYQTITLSRSTGFFSGGQSDPVTGAVVSVYSGSERFTFSEAAAGSYISDKPFEAVEKREYTLNVEVDLDEDGTRDIYRAVTTVPPAVRLDGITVRESPEMEDRFEILMWGEVPYNEGYYLSFSVSRENVPFSDSLSKYRIMEDKYFGTGRIEGLPCFFFSKGSGDVIRTGETISMKVDVLPGDYGKFISEVRSELRGAVPLFSGPPSNVTTNIMLVSGTATEKPLGFFGSSSTSRAYASYLEEEYFRHPR